MFPTQHGAVAVQLYQLIPSIQTGVVEGGILSFVLLGVYMNDMAILHHVELAPYTEDMTAVATFLKLTLLVDYL